MRSSLATYTLGATSSTASALSGAPWGAVLALGALTLLLPVILKGWRDWRLDCHRRTVDRWAEARRRRQEDERRKLHHLIRHEVRQLPDPATRVETYLQLFEKTASDDSPQEPPQPGEGAGNSP